MFTGISEEIRVSVYCCVVRLQEHQVDSRLIKVFLRRHLLIKFEQGRDAYADRLLFVLWLRYTIRIAHK